MKIVEKYLCPVTGAQGDVFTCLVLSKQSKAQRDSIYNQENSCLKNVQKKLQTLQILC